MHISLDFRSKQDTDGGIFLELIHLHNRKIMNFEAIRRDEHFWYFASTDGGGKIGQEFQG